MKTAEELLIKGNRTLVTVPPESTLHVAIRKMVQNKIGSILVESEGKIIGIWTERDLLRCSLDTQFNPQKAIIKDNMQTDLHYASHKETIYQLMDKFLGLRIRHMLIKKKDRFIGMLSSGDIIQEALKEKANELQKLNQVFSWEYYENWNW